MKKIIFVTLIEIFICCLILLGVIHYWQYYPDFAPTSVRILNILTSYRRHDAIKTTRYLEAKQSKFCTENDIDFLKRNLEIQTFTKFYISSEEIKKNPNFPSSRENNSVTLDSKNDCVRLSKNFILIRLILLEDNYSYNLDQMYVLKYDTSILEFLSDKEPILEILFSMKGIK